MSGHEGHRARIIQKLDSGVLLDHEILEVLLFNAIPRRNTNDLAHRLLAEFRTVTGVFEASMEQLLQVEGVGPSVAAYLRCIGVFYNKYYNEQGEEFPFEYNQQAFVGYIKRKYKKLNREVMDVYFMDSNGEIYAKGRFSEDSLFSVEISTEELARLFAEKKPSGIVVVHNHPLGVAKPSDEDDYVTRKVQLLCSMQNVLFCDHLIYGDDGVYSYSASGSLQQISKECSVQNLLPKKGK